MASAERTSTMSSLRSRLTAASTTGLGTTWSTRAGMVDTPLGGDGCGRGASAAPGVLPPKLCRLPNMSGLLELQERGQLDAGPLAGRLGSGAAGDVHADGAEHVVGAIVGGDFSDHLAVVGGGAEGGGVERDRAQQPALDRLGEFLRRDLGTLRHAELVDHQQRFGF